MTKTPQLLKGFRDFYPEQMAFRNWLYGKAKKVAESFGFEEYEGPIVETLDLYAAKSGEELVKKQAFTLTDKSGKILALRPEMTPTLARMVAQKAGGLIFPVKWFSFGPRFRYETPQRGRGREFFQWDADILGLTNPEADAEVTEADAHTDGRQRPQHDAPGHELALSHLGRRPPPSVRVAAILRQDFGLGPADPWGERRQASE